MLKRFLPALLFCVLCLEAAPAEAFEREWHLGVGLGASDLSASGVGWGPELGVHGAYGISDSFDVRLEGRLSRHSVRLEIPGVPAIDEARSFLRAEASLAYKLDILRWVPWFSIGAGYFQALEEPSPEQDLRRLDGLVSGMFGVDYAVTRSFGLGFAARYAVLFAGSADYGAQLRAEYRWGF